MSLFIDQAFVEQFTSNIFHLAQQKGSRLRAAVRNETQVGESAFYERLGATAAVEKASRHGDTPLIDTPHSRRRVTLRDFEIGDLIDDPDKIRTLIDPESAYSQAFMMALGRSIDDVIIENKLGNAFSGKDGSTAVPLPDSQKLVAHDGTATAGVNLNVRTLRAVKRLMDLNEVDPSISRWMGIQADALESLLAETEITSSDFNTVKALVNGEMNEFLSFTYVRLERWLQASAATQFNVLNGTVGAGTGSLVASTSRRLCAWASDGVILSIGQNPVGRIQERPDKSFSTQVFASMSIGATRLEEVKVVEVLINETV